MTFSATHNTDLWRVQLAISDFPNGTAKIERSANQVAWQMVRGGAALPISGGSGSLDDYEYFAAADGSLTTYYRVSSASLEDTVDVFTSSGTWNKPSGLVAAKITVIGGGGGGGGAPATTAGQVSGARGGNGGSLSISVIPAASLGSSETVTVGSGGSGSAGANGSDGGSSSFGTHVVAPGGGGGQAGSAGTPNQFGFSNPEDTVGGTGQVRVVGEAGDAEYRFAANDAARGGKGGSSAFGVGAGGGERPSSSDGHAGDLYGGGGSGAANGESQSARAGGDGAGGIVIVEHFFAGEGP